METLWTKKKQLQALMMEAFMKIALLASVAFVVLGNAKVDLTSAPVEATTPEKSTPHVNSTPEVHTKEPTTEAPKDTKTTKETPLTKETPDTKETTTPSMHSSSKPEATNHTTPSSHMTTHTTPKGASPSLFQSCSQLLALIPAILLLYV